MYIYVQLNIFNNELFCINGEKNPKAGYKFQNETDNICPFLSIRIRGKEEIIPFKDKKEIQSVKAHLCSVFSGFVKIGDWYLKMSEVLVISVSDEWQEMGDKIIDKL